MHDTSTRSPGSSVVTPLPISTMVPTASWPRIVPGFTVGTSPLRMWRSVPQIVDESIRTMTSVGSSSTGSGTSSQPRWPGPWYTSAFIWFLLSLVSHSRADRRRRASEVPRIELTAFPQRNRPRYARAVKTERSSEVRLRALLETGIALTSELSLESLLQTLVEATASLTGARYAALGVIDEAGTGLERVVT